MNEYETIFELVVYRCLKCSTPGHDIYYCEHNGTASNRHADGHAHEKPIHGSEVFEVVKRLSSVVT